jgi:hypothetical protein
VYTVREYSVYVAIDADACPVVVGTGAVAVLTSTAPACTTYVHPWPNALKKSLLCGGSGCLQDPAKNVAVDFKAMSRLVYKTLTQQEKQLVQKAAEVAQLNQRLQHLEAHHLQQLLTERADYDRQIAALNATLQGPPGTHV